MKTFALFLLLSLAACGQKQTEQKNTQTAAIVDSLSIPVYGMTCEGCVSAVTLSLQKTPGVQSVQVLLDEKRALIRRSDPAVATRAALETAILNTGYQVSENPDD